MPIYEFKCKNCSIIFESFVTSSRFCDGIKCPKCGSDQVKKQMSSFSFGGSAFGHGNGGIAPSMPSPGGCGSGRFS